MKKLICIIFLAGITFQLNAQKELWQTIIESPHHTHTNMTSQMYQIGLFAEQYPEEAFELCKQANMQWRQNGQVFIEVQYGWDVDKSSGELLRENPFFNWIVKIKNLDGGWILPKDLIAFSESIPESPFLITGANDYSSDHEGVTVTNATNWQVNGAFGQGIKIAIVDGGYSLLTNAQTAGTAPASPVMYDHTTSGNPFASGGNHGTGMVETIFEYATQSTYYLHKASSTTQFGLAVNQAIADNVDIIVRSASNFNTGWADGSGTVCGIVKDATDAGIIFMNGAGNFNLTHAQPLFSDTDANLKHNWTSTDNDNNVTINDGQKVIAHLQWLGVLSSTNNFDLILRNKSTGTILASSLSTNSYEDFTFTNNTGASISAGIEVIRTSSNKIRFELFGREASSLQYNQTGNSTASPANSLEELCITSSVVRHSNYNNSNPPLEGFCSRGPTNNGNPSVDLCTLDGQSLISYPNGFFGASAGGPNLAGITAILWSQNDNLSEMGIVQLLYAIAQTYNDWGDPGFDDSYGHGAPEFMDYISNHRFVAIEDYITSTNSFPYDNVEQADELAPEGTNIIILGDTWDTVPIFYDRILDKQMIYRSVGKDAIIK